MNERDHGKKVLGREVGGNKGEGRRKSRLGERGTIDDASLRATGTHEC